MSTPGQQISSTPAESPIMSLAWTNDGASVVVTALNLFGGGVVDGKKGAFAVLAASTGRAGGVGPDEPAFGSAPSPDGLFVAVAGASGKSTGIFTADKGTARFPPLAFDAIGASYCPNGTKIALFTRPPNAAEDRVTVQLVRANSGELLWNHDVPVGTADDLGLNFDARLVFSPDSHWLAVASPDGVNVFDADSGAAGGILSRPGGVTRVAFSPDSRLVAAAGHDGVVTIFDAQTGQASGTIPLGTTPVVSVAFSPDGRWLGAALRSGVGVFGVDDRNQRFRTPLVALTDVTEIAYSPDLRHLAVARAGADPAVPGLTVLDAVSGAVAWEQSTVRALHVAYSPDGRRLAAGGVGRADGTGLVVVHDTGVEQEKLVVPTAVTHVAVNSGGVPLVAVGTNDHVFIYSGGVAALDQAIPGSLNALAFSPDSQVLAAASSDGVLRLIPTLTATPTRLIKHGHAVNAVAFGGAAGELVATASADMTARVSTVATGALVCQLTHPNAVTQVLFGPDGSWIATGSADRATRVIDVPAGTQRHRFQGDGKVRALARSADGALLATGGDDRLVTLLDTATGETRGQLVHRKAVTALAISSDGWLASGSADQSVLVAEIADLVSGQPAPPVLFPYSSPVAALAIHPNQPVFAVATEDGAVHLVRYPDGPEILLLSHPRPVTDIVFSPDGRHLVTACDDGAARVFLTG